MKILLIGPQGSGKSTQGQLLADYLRIPYISTGDIFREKLLQDTAEGRQIKQTLDKGQLVDDQTTKTLITDRLQRTDAQNGYILDGYPRTSEQVDLFTTSNFKPDWIVYLKIPDDIAIKRLIRRGRADDTPELIKTRLQLYKDKTAALLGLLKGYGHIVEINGEGAIEEVQQRMRDALNGQ